MSKDRVPIIILNWNGLSDTIECLTSVLSMAEFPAEIILVDNGSAPEVRNKLLSLYGSNPEVRLVLNDENKGFTRGNYDIVMDLLQRDTPPEFVALLNNDTVVAPNWIESLVASARVNEADIVSSKMINYYDRRKIDNVGHFMLNTGEILPLGHRKPKENFTEVFENLGACGGAALYRTSMIEEIGFFDLYFDTGYEDAEFGLRAKLLGYKCIFEPKAVVYHKVSRSINKIRDDAYLQHIQMNIFYTYLKLMPRKFLWSNLIFVLTKYTIWFMFGILTFQFKLMRLHTDTLSKYFKKDLKIAMTRRREFYEKHESILKGNSRNPMPTDFFLLTDFRRLLFHLFPK